MQVHIPRAKTYHTYYAWWGGLHEGQASTSVGPRPRRPWQHLLLLALTCIGVIALSHALTEVCALRFCQPWGLEDLQKVRFFQKEVARPSIVYLGTSQIHDGVMPHVVQEASGCDPGFNLAVPGANLEISWVLARDLLHGERCPQVVVLGVFPVIMDAKNRNALDFYCRYASLDDLAEQVQEGVLSPSVLASTSLRGLENVLQFPWERWKKPVPRYTAAHLRQGQGCTWLPEQRHEAITVSATQWQQRQEKFAADTTAPLHFHDASRPARMLLRFHALAQERGFRLLIVQPPQALHQPATDARFRQWMTAFCDQHGLEYHDLHTGHTHHRTDFADPLHLNACGAHRFSLNLGYALAVPQQYGPSPTLALAPFLR